MKAKINKVTVEIAWTNIYELEVEGFVNATDPTLTIPDELEALAGKSLRRETTLLGWCDVGSALATEPGTMPVKKIIHAVGPRWGEGSERGKLANATWTTLQLAENHQLRSIAIPPISTGAMGYPVENCAKTMLTQIIDFTFEDVKFLRKITVCVQTESEYNAFVAEFRQQIEDLKNTGEGKVRV